MAPMPSGLHPIQIPLNSRLPDVSLQLHVPQTFKDQPDEVFMPLNITNPALYFCSLTSTDVSNAKNEARAVGIDEQVTGEMEIAVEREEVARVPYDHLHLTPLTSVRAEAAEELIIQARTRTSHSMSPAPSIFNSTPNLHRGYTISSPHSFANVISHAESLNTLPFLRPPPDFYSTSHPSDSLQQDEQLLPEELPSTTDDTSDTSWNAHSISPSVPSYNPLQYPVFLRSRPSTPFSPK